MSAALTLYRGLSRCAAPAVRLWLNRRAARGREDPARLAERRGIASAPRPQGPLVWLHGASVGEGLAALSLIAPLAQTRPDLRFVLTTGTRASAELVGPQTPAGAVHQFAPLDVAPWVARFLAHWRPQLCVRIDSELWPETLCAVRAPMALVNARISARSARGWSRAPAMARALLGRFALIAAQDAQAAARFAALGARPETLSVGGALKAAAAPPAADPAALAALAAQIASRPVWLAASTHEGEEAMALAAHRAAALPGLLTLIAPRHPARGEAVAALAQAQGLNAARRAAGRGPAGADVYVADTLGEMGLWYRLAPFAFIGGSVTPMGGHNPYEPAALGVALAHGPDVSAFAEAYDALRGIARPTPDAATLAQALRWALAPGGGATEAATAAGAAAKAALARDPGALDRLVPALLALLP